MQGVIRGAVGNEDASALREGNVFGKAVDLRFERESVFGVGAGKTFGDIDAVAGFYFCDAWDDRVDYAGAVGGGSVGKLRKHGVIAGAGIGVGGLDKLGRGFARGMCRGGLWDAGFF